jgi:4-amino-4-deoxy-L-arabinose transferase-like glycosyltransferase
MTPFQAAFDRASLAFAAVLIVMTAIRINLLFMNPVGLGVDEAQYWAWSHSIEWGYFTKPPMIAWVIGLTTAIFGDVEWAVRLGAPIAHAVAATALYLLGRSTYGAWPGFWAGFSWLMLPGVFFSSSLISTDALLLPLWSIALFAMWRLMNTRAMAWAIVVGVFVGFGVLAKYAMLYFIFCTALAALWLEPMRQALGKGRAIVAGLIALLIVAPNLYWNAQNGFATARHTASNAGLNLDNMFHFDELFEFIFGQAGVLGPLIFFALIWLIWRTVRRSDANSVEDKFLFAYILPPFVFISIIAFVSRSNANWAAVAYPAIVVWLTGVLFATRNGRVVLFSAIALNMALGIFVAGVFTFNPAYANQFKNIRNAQGWSDTAQAIAERAIVAPGEPPFTAIMVDDRDLYFELNYHWRDLRRDGVPLPPLRMWLLHGEAENSAEQRDPMRTEEGARVLVVHQRADYIPFVAGDFTVFRNVEHLAVSLGVGRSRDLEISVGEGFAPAVRDEAFRERVMRRDDD